MTSSLLLLCVRSAWDSLVAHQRSNAKSKISILFWLSQLCTFAITASKYHYTLKSAGNTWTSFTLRLVLNAEHCLASTWLVCTWLNRKCIFNAKWTEMIWGMVVSLDLHLVSQFVCMTLMSQKYSILIKLLNKTYHTESYLTIFS